MVKEMVYRATYTYMDDVHGGFGEASFLFVSEIVSLRDAMKLFDDYLKGHGTGIIRGMKSLENLGFLTDLGSLKALEKQEKAP